MINLNQHNLNPTLYTTIIHMKAPKCMRVIHDVAFMVNIGFLYTHLRELMSTWHLMCLVLYFEEVQILTFYNMDCNLAGQILLFELGPQQFHSGKKGQANT